MLWLRNSTQMYYDYQYCLACTLTHHSTHKECQSDGMGMGHIWGESFPQISLIPQIISPTPSLFIEFQTSWKSVWHEGWKELVKGYEKLVIGAGGVGEKKGQRPVVLVFWMDENRE